MDKTKAETTPQVAKRAMAELAEIGRMEREARPKTGFTKTPQNRNSGAVMAADRRETGRLRPPAVGLDLQTTAQDQPPGSRSFCQGHPPERATVEGPIVPASAEIAFCGIDIGMTPVQPRAEVQPACCNTIRQQRRRQRKPEDSYGVMDEELQGSEHTDDD